MDVALTRRDFAKHMSGIVRAILRAVAIVGEDVT